MKIGKVVVADTVNGTCSAVANISSIIAEGIFSCLKKPIKIVAVEDIYLSYSNDLEQVLLLTKPSCIFNIPPINKSYEMHVGIPEFSFLLK